MSMEAGLPALALIFLLGMRHGLEPDHLAAVDGLTLRSQAASPRWAPWMGALFALGHGLCVLAIVAVAALASGVLPGWVLGVCAGVTLVSGLDEAWLACRATTLDADARGSWAA